MAVTINTITNDNRITRLANESITAGKAVNLDSDGEWNLADSGDRALGISLNGASAGEPVTAAIPGPIVKATVLGNSANIAQGDLLKPDTGSAGKLIKTTTDTDEVIGVALEAATADDVEIDVMLVFMNHSV